MSQRRFHTKSRHGCVQCKKNRTKCDENKPHCGRCKRIGAVCSLADQPSNLVFLPAKNVDVQAQASNESSHNKQKSSSLSDEYSSPSPGDLLSVTMSTPSTEQSNAESYFARSEKERLRLMNHYALHTSRSITEIILPKDQDQSMWGDWVPELAFEHDFLLHGLLGLSALHLALRGISQQKHTVMAIHHHNLGLALFRPHLSNVTPDNRDAIFAFSCVVALYTFGIQRSSEPTEDPINRIYHVFSMIRGSALFVKSDHDAMEQSHWSVLMLPYPFPSVKLPGEMEDMLNTILQRIPTTSTATQIEIYQPAIRTLRDSLAMAILYRRTKMTLSYFPVVCPPEFWAMVRISEPLSLAILANYAVTLHWLRMNIWMECWGKEIVNAVHQVLPLDWHDCIAWAVRETDRPSQADDYEIEDHSTSASDLLQAKRTLP
ncbi:hypothetical protein BO94DRAFT_470979 [Aspergillus sclerotioniger CBS 115572]|uniref:Zn(2)-C6 fungal-type domain-containing protein n=1 Tax=Aspergillus sclerotioniger CBS 115572 TaxID=1450535 RepID=A0A317W0U7_9EURO|nr:hypothetical protein BO94DRAFT_470979 [Aspergillus sclerotioniger CBS 115572]PWY80266.1 hypothetical protein BO94DRAFT_470979 [Aspergillus sclerotioniger CBS 115572]